MDAKPNATGGVYSVPSVWRGPPGEIPEKIKKDGLDPQKVHVDPSKLVRFANYDHKK